jgi:hypothetical protein
MVESHRLLGTPTSNDLSSIIYPTTSNDPLLCVFAAIEDYAHKPQRDIVFRFLKAALANSRVQSAINNRHFTSTGSLRTLLEYALCCDQTTFAEVLWFSQSELNIQIDLHVVNYLQHAVSSNSEHLFSSILSVTPTNYCQWPSSAPIGHNWPHYTSSAGYETIVDIVARASECKRLVHIFAKAGLDGTELDIDTFLVPFEGKRSSSLSWLFTWRTVPDTQPFIHMYGLCWDRVARYRLNLPLVFLEIAQKCNLLHGISDLHKVVMAYLPNILGK